MSGHNKWSKIKHVKAKEDAKKGKVFARFARDIIMASKNGGDPDLNPRLRAAIDGAKAISMPKENIERAIKKGTGEGGGAIIQEVTYEGYGPAGTAYLVEVSTDNTNRSAAEVRTLFGKNGGSIATPGSVAYQFERKGEVCLLAPGLDEDMAMELALESGCDEVTMGDHDNEWRFITSATELSNVADCLRASGNTVTAMRLIQVAPNITIISDADTAKTAMRLFELLDDYDDTMNVFSNFDVSEDILEQL